MDITDAQWYVINLLDEYFNIKFTGKTKQDAMQFIKRYENKYKEAKIEKERNRYHEYNDWSCDDHDNYWW
jgi:hypothetical protein